GRPPAAGLPASARAARSGCGAWLPARTGDGVRTGGGARRAHHRGCGEPREGDHNMNEVLRNTKQRSAVSAVLADAEGFHSAQDLHAMLRDRGERVGLTTVYRTLQGLADAGEIDVMRPPGGEHLY